MKEIKIHFCDFWMGHSLENDFFLNLLKDKYNFIIDKKNPDFVICSCYADEYKKFDCPRIFYSGENITPDFNVYDYAISFDYLDFGKRYLRGRPPGSEGPGPGRSRSARRPPRRRGR